jgi:DNA invertase Pin-like site-specific DNA recombinase
MKSELVTATHQARKAVIYIRQSTPQQVMSHQESLRLQYALKERALAWGWPAERIETIDRDLGQTGGTIVHREGFKELLAQVALGEVGLILSTEVTRLSRNCSDWFPLLDVCAYQGCLIADGEGVYDPASANGRLLLGLKGQISEMELHTIQLRLRAGLLNKARRGDLALRLPVGLRRTEDGQIVKDPHQEVQSRIALVFNTFLRFRSAGKTMRFFHQQKLTLPRRDRFGNLIWRKASVRSILDMLKNPAYAGAFVYGRTRTQRDGDGKIVTKKVAMSQWHVCIQDKYPAYINWETYAKIQEMLADNYTTYQNKASRGTPRSGSAMLQGIVYCGACGCQLSISYKNGLSYVCSQQAKQLGEPTCRHFPGQVVDEAVVDAFFQALSPVELDVYARALAAQKEQSSQVAQAQQQQLKRLRYQEALAQRQYNQVDPDNRLVAAELERRWEAALRTLKEAEEEIARQPEKQPERPLLTPALRQAFNDIGRRLPQVWADGVLSSAQKKSLLRCLVDKVVLDKPVREQVQVRIVWRGGDHTTLTLPIVVISLGEMSIAAEMKEKVMVLTREGKTDREIAQLLSQQGYRSPRDTQRLRPCTVAKIRREGGIRRIKSRPQRISGYLTLSQIAQYLGVSRNWLYYRIWKGEIQVNKDATTGLYLFPDRPQTLTWFSEFRAGQRETLDFITQDIGSTR